MGRVCPHPLGDAGQRQVETSLCLYGAGNVRDAGNFALDRFRLFQCRFHCVQRAVPAGDIGVFWRDHPPEADVLHDQRRGLPADGKYSHISLYLSRSGSACAGDPAAAGRSAHGSGDAHRGWHHGSDGKALGPEAGAGTAAAGGCHVLPGVVVVLNMLLMVSGGRFDATQFSVLFTVGLTVAVLVHLLFVQMLNEQVVQKKDSQYRATLEQERAEALMESYTTQRRLTHEFSNHLEALSLMLQQNDVAGARGYLTSISKTIQMNSAILNTHNPLLDALLSKKYEEAARKGVMMYFDLSDLKDIPLDRTHLVIVVSNLLNNAIEAAAQAAPPEVHVRMKKTEGELVISVRNRVRQNVEIPEGQLPRSTKREPGHGMGLANVCAVLEAHNAEYTLSCRDNWFRFTCAFPTNGI